MVKVLGYTMAAWWQDYDPILHTSSHRDTHIYLTHISLTDTHTTHIVSHGDTPTHTDRHTHHAILTDIFTHITHNLFYGDTQTHTFTHRHTITHIFLSQRYTEALSHTNTLSHLDTHATQLSQGHRHRLTQLTHCHICIHSLPLKHTQCTQSTSQCLF